MTSGSARGVGGGSAREAEPDGAEVAARDRAQGAVHAGGSDPVPVEILHTAGCGGWEAARAALLRVAEEEGVAVALTERSVWS